MATEPGEHLRRSGASAPKRTLENGDRDRVLAATDLASLIGEHVALRQKGRELVGLCPFHDDHSPSMAVVTHKGDGFYKCFSCGAAGNAIDFAMNFLRLDFRGALEFLAQRAGIALTPLSRRAGEAGGVGRAALIEANAEAMRHWTRLLAGGRAGRTLAGAAAEGARVVAERGIADEMIEQFQLGVSANSWDDLLEHARSRSLDVAAFSAAGLLKSRKEGGGHYDAFRNRVMFPICDEAGRPIAFGARRIDPADDPKYLNSAESAVFHKSRTLYGLHLAKRPIIDADAAIVTEGYTDVIACHQFGIRNVVATLGTALTSEHARVLRRMCSRVILLFDGDEAGQKAADRAAEVFFTEPVDVLVCALPDGHDPDELLRLEAGPARFRAAIDASVPVLDFLVDRFNAAWRGAAGFSARQQRLEAFLARLSELGLSQTSTLRREHTLRRLAELTGFSVSALHSAMPRRDGRGATRNDPSKAALRPLRPDLDATRSPLDADGSESAPGGQLDVPFDSSGAPPDGEGESRSPAPSTAEPLPPMAILKAESTLLGLLVRHPELASGTVDAGDGHHLPILEAFPAASFRHLPHRALAEALLPLVEDGASGPESGGGRASMARLMALVARDDLRLLASDLYFSAEQRTAGRLDAAAELLRQVCADLDLVRKRLDASDRPATDGPLDASGAARMIERFRDRGHDPSAISFLVRR